MPPQQPLFLSNRHDQRSVELERRDAGSSNCGQPDHLQAVPAKVFTPGLLARIEDAYHLVRFGISNLLSGSFAKRARDTGKGEILGGGLSADRARDHVVDMENGLLTFLRQPAVFATIASAFPHQLAEPTGNGHGRLARNFSKESVSASCTNPSASRRSASVSSSPRSCVSSKACSRSCTPEGSWNWLISPGRSNVTVTPECRTGTVQSQSEIAIPCRS